MRDLLGPSAGLVPKPILVPVLRRPHRVVPFLESARATSDARVLFLCSPNDIAEQQAIEDVGGAWLKCPFAVDRGDYARKINYGSSSSAPMTSSSSQDGSTPRSARWATESAS